ncbi:hypothetical protein V493_05018 [Pseudogymnoascus sp. VKM F-4281 (FW-2241)]|nr:hypothetical protein V493_05018 [Pseudogymnoascus sp. VKM F-4281 (FW-2241)]
MSPQLPLPPTLNSLRFGRTTSSSTSSSSSSGSSSATTPLTPRTTSPTPSTETVSDASDMSDKALAKASQEFARELAKLEREKVELKREIEKIQRERNELKSACDKADLACKQKEDSELELQRKEIQQKASVAAGVLLFIPALSVAITLFVAQTVGGIRMLISRMKKFGRFNSPPYQRYEATTSMSHPPPLSLSPSPSPSSSTCSPRSISTNSTRSNTTIITPRDISPDPSYEMAQITLRQREVALAKALRQLEREKATFRLERDCLQRESDEPAKDKAALATKQRKESLPMSDNTPPPAPFPRPSSPASSTTSWASSMLPASPNDSSPNTGDGATQIALQEREAALSEALQELAVKQAKLANLKRDLAEMEAMRRCNVPAHHRNGDLEIWQVAAWVVAGMECLIPWIFVVGTTVEIQIVVAAYVARTKEEW